MLKQNYYFVFTTPSIVSLFNSQRYYFAQKIPYISRDDKRFRNMCYCILIDYSLCSSK